MLEPLDARLLFTIPGTTLGVWDTYPTLSAELQTINAAYPSLTRLVNAGTSAQGRTIWAMRITDNPTVEENEPEFLFNGPMHGDETVGVELSFYFIQHLLESYGQSTGDGPRLTNLVNNMDIWVVPSMNPDGYARAGGPIRENANGIDLNRNFPEWTTRSFSSSTVLFGPFGNVFDHTNAGTQPNQSGLQAETRAIMNFRRQHHFVSSATFHGGDLIANYPWDSNGNTTNDYAYTPDQNLFYELALTYSRQNPSMFSQNSSADGFINGTVNGDRWYPVSGGLQDWALLYTGAFDLTLEIGYDKNPPASTLPTYWAQNRESILQYMEAANWGVRGTVIRSSDSAPVYARVTVVSPPPSPAPDPNHPATLPVYTDDLRGDFHRILLPGTYSLQIEAPGYQPQTITGVQVSSQTNDPSATIVRNVILSPLDNVRPVLTDSSFEYDESSPELEFAFSEPVGASVTASDLVLTNLTTGQSVDPSLLSVEIRSGGDELRFDAPGLPGGVLPDGNWQARLPATEVRDAWGNRLAQDAVLSFHVLAGDGDRDRDIDLDDFARLAARFNLPGLFSQGDFDYSGTVSIDDFSIVAAKFNRSLPPVGARVSATGSRAVGQFALGAAEYPGLVRDRNDAPRSLFADEPLDLQ